MAEELKKEEELVLAEGGVPKEESAVKEEPAVEVTSIETNPIVEEPKGEGEQPKVIGLRERMISRGKKLFPEDFKEDEYDDDAYEKLALRVMDKDDENDERLDKLVTSNRKLFNIFQENPDTYEVFSRLKDGMPLPDALVDVYGDDEVLRPDKGSDFWKKYEDKKSKEKAQRELIESNSEASEKAREEYYKEAGMSDSDIKAFEDAESALYASMADGRLDKDYFKKLYRAINYDKDIEGSYEQGKVDGANKKIKNEIRRTIGDGLPHFEGEGGAGKGKGERPKSEMEKLFAGIAERSQKSKWD